ncbi:MAG: hypothetical protein NVSMB64_18470 [Candidatus Velthaea sp.]
MSFLNNLGGILQQFTTADKGDVAAAAADHVGGMDAAELVGHLTGGAQNMDSGTLGNLARSLIGALGAHGHDESAIQAAGVSTGDAQAGDASAVTALISHAQQNPAALKDAAVDFIKNNPQALEQFAPDFVKGLLTKFGG